MGTGALLKIRILQIYRVAQAIGVIRAILVLLFLVFVLLMIYQSLTKSEDTHNIMLGAFSFGLLFFHLKRADYDFLRKNSEQVSLLIFIEYLFFLSPILVLFIVTSWYRDAGILLIVLLTITVLVKPSKRSLSIKQLDLVSRFLPSDLFEWKAGLRKNFIWIALLEVLGLGGSFFSVVIPILGIVLISIVVCTFYGTCESREILEAKEIGAKPFLIHKLKRHLACWAILISPLVLVALVHYFFIIYSMVVFLMVANMFICILLLKYFFYAPHHQSPSTGILGAIVILLSLVPGFCLIIWIYNFILFGKTIHHLDTYLHDYN